MIINLKQEKIIFNLLNKIKSEYPSHKVKYDRLNSKINLIGDGFHYQLDVAEEKLPKEFNIKFFLDECCVPFNRLIGIIGDKDDFIQPELILIDNFNIKSTLSDKFSKNIRKKISTQPIFKSGILQSNINIATNGELYVKHLKESTIYIDDIVDGSIVYKVDNGINPLLHYDVLDIVLSEPSNTLIAIPTKDTLVVNNGVSLNKFMQIVKSYYEASNNKLLDASHIIIKNEELFEFYVDVF